MTTTTTDGYGLKRKLRIGEEGSMYFVFYSNDSPKAAALFECKMATTTATTTEDYDVNKVDVFTGDLTEVATFYDQNRTKRITYVACCPFRGNYLFFPNEFHPLYDTEPDKHDITRAYPCLLNLLPNNSNKVVEEFMPPPGPKAYPLAVSMSDNKIYVLSCRKHVLFTLVEPSFEAYDMVSKTWEILPAPWFNENKRTPWFNKNKHNDVTWGWATTGYAVFEDFIIFCLWNLSHPLPKHAIYSYNTFTRKWKPVAFNSKTRVTIRDESRRVFDTNDDEEAHDQKFHADFRIWVGEAVVVNNFLHGFTSEFGTMVSYSCTKVSGRESDLLLGDDIIMEPTKTGGESEFFENKYVDRWFVTGGVAKIGHDLICMVKTIYSSPRRDYTSFQPVYVKIFQIHQGGSRTALKVFHLRMPRGKHFDFARLASCFMLQPEEEDGEGSPKKRLLSYNDALVSRVEMMETSMA